MKLTATQLRRIIREEVESQQINEFLGFGKEKDLDPAKKNSFNSLEYEEALLKKIMKDPKVKKGIAAINKAESAIMSAGEGFNFMPVVRGLQQVFAELVRSTEDGKDVTDKDLRSLFSLITD